VPMLYKSQKFLWVCCEAGPKLNNSENVGQLNKSKSSSSRSTACTGSVVTFFRYRGQVQHHLNRYVFFLQYSAYRNPFNQLIFNGVTKT